MSAGARGRGRKSIVAALTQNLVEDTPPATSNQFHSAQYHPPNPSYSNYANDPHASPPNYAPPSFGPSPDAPSPGNDAWTTSQMSGGSPHQQMSAAYGGGARASASSGTPRSELVAEAPGLRNAPIGARSPSSPIGARSQIPASAAANVVGGPAGPGAPGPPVSPQNDQEAARDHAGTTAKPGPVVSAADDLERNADGGAASAASPGAKSLGSGGVVLSPTEPEPFSPHAILLESTDVILTPPPKRFKARLEEWQHQHNDYVGQEHNGAAHFPEEPPLPRPPGWERHEEAVFQTQKRPGGRDPGQRRQSAMQLALAGGRDESGGLVSAGGDPHFLTHKIKGSEADEGTLRLEEAVFLFAEQKEGALLRGRQELDKVLLKAQQHSIDLLYNPVDNARQATEASTNSASFGEGFPGAQHPWPLSRGGPGKGQNEGSVGVAKTNMGGYLASVLEQVEKTRERQRELEFSRKARQQVFEENMLRDLLERDSSTSGTRSRMKKLIETQRKEAETPGLEIGGKPVQILVPGKKRGEILAGMRAQAAAGRGDRQGAGGIVVQDGGGLLEGAGLGDGVVDEFVESTRMTSADGNGTMGIVDEQFLQPGGGYNNSVRTGGGGSGVARVARTAASNEVIVRVVGADGNLIGGGGGGSTMGPQPSVNNFTVVVGGDGKVVTSSAAGTTVGGPGGAGVSFSSLLPGVQSDSQGLATLPIDQNNTRLETTAAPYGRSNSPEFFPAAGRPSPKRFDISPPSRGSAGRTDQGRMVSNAGIISEHKDGSLGDDRAPAPRSQLDQFASSLSLGGCRPLGSAESTFPFARKRDVALVERAIELEAQKAEKARVLAEKVRRFLVSTK